MRRFILTTTLLCLTLAVWAFKYQITGTVENPDYYGKRMKLLNANKMDGATFLPVDSCICGKDGKFKFDGTHNDEVLGVIGVEVPVEGGIRTEYIGNVVITSGKTKMNMASGLPEAKKGVNSQLATFILRKTDYTEQYRNKSLNKETFEALMRGLCLTTLMHNIHNPVGQYALYYKFYFLSPEEWLEEYNTATDYLKDFDLSKDLALRIEATQKTETGHRFINIEGYDINGKATSLADFAGKGKITVVDFWASWCRPCIAEMKTTLLPLYEKYGIVGTVEFVGIGVSDAPTNLAAAVRNFNIPWHQIMDTRQNPGDIYGFSAIPFIIVLDGDGNIVARDIRGQELSNLIQKLTSGE